MAAGYKVCAATEGKRGEGRGEGEAQGTNERDSKVWFIWEEIADGTTARRRVDRADSRDEEEREREHEEEKKRKEK